MHSTRSVTPSLSVSHQHTHFCSLPCRSDSNVICWDRHRGWVKWNSLCAPLEESAVLFCSLLNEWMSYTVLEPSLQPITAHSTGGKLYLDRSARTRMHLALSAGGSLKHRSISNVAVSPYIHTHTHLYTTRLLRVWNANKNQKTSD